MNLPTNNNMNTPASNGFSQSGDIFDSSQGNIFEAMANRGQQQNTDSAMPQGMPQRPPVQQQQPANPTETPMRNSMDGSAVSPQQQQQQAQSASPLDNYLPKPDNGTVDASNGQQQQQQQLPKSVFDSTREDYQKLAANQDYASGLTPEVLQQIMSGDVNALATVLNNVGRMAFTNAAFASGKIAGSGYKSSLEQFQQSVLPGLMRDNNFKVAYEANDHKILKHPAVAPLVESQTQTFRNQFPNASPKEIQDKVTAYFQDFAQALMGNATAGQQQQQVSNQQQADSNGLEKLFNI